MSDISGLVVDDFSGKPIAGVQIAVMSNASGLSTGLVASTDSSGSFLITGNPFTEGDTDKYLSFVDPSGNHSAIVYPFVQLNNIKASMIPYESTKTIGIPVLIGGLLLFLIAGYFLFFKRPK